MWFWYFERKMIEVFTNNEDPDQMPHSEASDLGLHFWQLPIRGLKTTMG